MMVRSLALLGLALSGSLALPTQLKWAQYLDGTLRATFPELP